MTAEAVMEHCIRRQAGGGGAHRILVGLIALFLLLAGAPAFAQCNFAGTWRDGEGTTITMTQTGNAVSGSYLWRGAAGSISGTAAGSVLTGTYQQPAYAEVQWRSGPMTLTLLADCSGWSGSYANSAGADRRPWSATRIGPTPSSASITRIALQGVVGGRTITADLQRTEGAEWTWLEDNVTFRFRLVSESRSEIVIHDSSRDRYHQLNLLNRQTFWRIGTSAPWNPHYTITAIE